MSNSAMCGPPGTWTIGGLNQRMMTQPGQHFQQQDASTCDSRSDSWFQDEWRQSQHRDNHGPTRMPQSTFVPQVHGFAQSYTRNCDKRSQQASVMAESTFTNSSAVAARTNNDLCENERPFGMLEQLQSLQLENPRQVLIARGIHTLGFQSAQKLEEYFGKFGLVRAVLVPHSRVKATPGRRARARTGNIGFIVMHSSEAAQAVLAQGGTQYIAGCSVTMSSFEKRVGVSALPGMHCTNSEPCRAVAPSFATHGSSPCARQGLELTFQHGNRSSHTRNKQWSSLIQSPDSFMDSHVSSKSYSTAAGSSGSSGSSTPNSKQSGFMCPQWSNITEVEYMGKSHAFNTSLENRLETMVLCDQGFVTDDDF